MSLVGRDILNIDTSFATAFETASLDLMDLESVRLILSGGSVIDWHKLDLTSLDAVDGFLRVSKIDPDDPRDMERLRFVFNQAINYLEEHHSIRFPDDLRDPVDVREIFIVASGWHDGFRRRQSLACMVLKIMHTINHMEAADLMHRAPISEAEIIDRAERAIIEQADEMRRDGYPLLAFYSSRKTRTSVISKLLSKRESIAATVFDKLRFRIVVETPDEILPLLGYLMRSLFPVNYVIPGESKNTLVDLRQSIAESEHLQGLEPDLQLLTESAGSAGWDNPFSSSSYKIINFIVDYPVRVDDVVEKMGLSNATYLLGRIVYVMVEFQVVDQVTARDNEEGANAHHLYKSRQKKRVEARLLKGSLADKG